MITQMLALLVPLAQVVTTSEYLDDRPIPTVRYGPAGMSPPPPPYDHSLIHDIGAHQAIEWISEASEHGTPLTLNGSDGREMDRRLWGEEGRTGHDVAGWISSLDHQ